MDYFNLQGEENEIQSPKIISTYKHYIYIYIYISIYVCVCIDVYT